MKTSIRNIIVISDTHFGCQLGLCPPSGVKMDSGGEYHQSDLQKKTWAMWKEFWNVWVPKVTKGEDFVLVHNGDAVDGVHHGSVTQITHNITKQKNIAEIVLGDVIGNKRCKKYFHVRGTEAHVGQSGQDEESLAQVLGAVPDEIGNAARWELWLRFGNDVLVNFTHHVGTTSSAAYESTAPYKELIEAFVEAGKTHEEPPDVIVRSHRHRSIKVEVPTSKGNGIAIVTPGFQLKTPFTYRLALGRSAPPQIGGILLRSGSEDRIYTRSKIWNIERPPEMRI